jgi:hypothetical protein
MFETGVGIKNPLFFLGVVEDVVDPRKEGRVKVRAFNVHGTNKQIATDFLPWAIVCWGSYDPNYRLYLNDWVFGVFLDGRDAQQPMILGLVPTQMTKAPDPENDGYGSYPATNCENQMGPRGADSFGDPRNSRTHRGEDLEQTWIKQAEQMRTRNIEGVAGTEPWAEPGIAANPEYPFNRTIETSKHRIEIDDTEGAERITIHHNSGSYIQISDEGIVTNKARNDRYDISDRGQYVHVKGVSNVVIEGNAYVKVNGNKTEEIDGNYIQMIHGNHIMSVGGESNINAANLVQIRGANVKMQANAGDMALHATQNIRMEGDETMSMKGQMIWLDGVKNISLDTATYSLNASLGGLVKTLGYLNFEAKTGLDITGGTLGTRINAGTLLDIQGGTTAKINAGTVAVDNIISLANGAAASAVTAAVIPIPIPLESGLTAAHKPKMPEPVAYNTALTDDDLSAKGGNSTTGVAGRDQQGEEELPPPPPEFTVEVFTDSNGGEQFLVIDTTTGQRAQPESGMATSYDTRDAAQLAIDSGFQFDAYNELLKKAGGN